MASRTRALFEDSYNCSTPAAHRFSCDTVITKKRETVKDDYYCMPKKEDMKQWYEKKMRKWSHTISTCYKATHPHSPLIDHGSCGHRVYAKLSFLWFKKSNLL